MQPSIRDAIVLGRQGARERGVARLTAEAESLGVDVDFIIPSTSFMRDWARASDVSSSYTRRWLRKAEETESARDASIETAGSLERIGATESSSAFSAGRTDALRLSGVTELMRVWDAESDACPVCRSVEGEMVSIHQAFSIGEPGSVHSFCRCGWTAVSVTLKSEPENG